MVEIPAGLSLDANRAAEYVRSETLRLCTIITEVCPKGRRLESALASIRAGVRLALEELAQKQTLLTAAEASEGRSRAARLPGNGTRG